MPIRDSYEPGRPCWVDLGTSDPAAARSFYSELFGWSADVDPRPEARGYAQFRNGEHAVAGVGPIMAEGMPPVWAPTSPAPMWTPPPPRSPSTAAP